VLVAVLAMFVIGSAARSRFRQPDIPAAPAAAVNLQTPVPAPVLSTLRRGCFDCHSDHTRWPWYSALPVVSWLIERDVKEGLGQLNFSRWAQYNPFDRADMLDKVCALAANRKMPLLPYRLLHSEARLSATDVAELCAWSRREAARLVEGGS
jgi:hypothetical protein